MWRPRANSVRPVRHEERYQLIADVGRAALSDEPLPALFDLVTRRLPQALDASCCSILELGEDGSLLLVSGSGWEQGTVGTARLAADEESPASYALTSGTPVVVHNFHHEARFPMPAHLARHGVTCGLSLVIPDMPRPRGVLEVFRRQPQAFTEVDLHTVQALTHLLGSAIRRQAAEQELRAASQRLEQRVQERSEALLEANVRLRQSEELFRTLFDGATTGVMLTDFHGTILEANAALGLMLDYPREELLQRQIWELSHTDDVKAERQLFRELTADGRNNYQLEKRFLTRQGDTLWVHFAISIVRDAAGRPLCTLATAQDTSARKEAELALRMSQEQFQTIFRLGPMAACISTLPGGQILDVNAQFERILGHHRQDVVGKTIAELKLWAEPSSRRNLLATIGRRGYARNVEIAATDRNGQPRTLLASFERLQLAGGDHLLGMFEDISDRKQLERDLTEARLKLADLRERERLKMARELHDGAVQQLIGISYGIDQTQKKANALGDEGLSSDLKTHRAQVLDVARQLRELISNLRPAGLQELGLAATLESYVANARRDLSGKGPDIRLCLQTLDKEPSEAVSVCLLRVTQEALRNSVKHAHAQHISITLGARQGMVFLEVQDDGVGAALPTTLDALVKDDHFGLVGMQERVSSVGGELALRSRPGQGMSVSLRVPYESEEQHA